MPARRPAVQAAVASSYHNGAIARWVDENRSPGVLLIFHNLTCVFFIDSTMSSTVVDFALSAIFSCMCQSLAAGCAHMHTRVVHKCADTHAKHTCTRAHATCAHTPQARTHRTHTLHTRIACITHMLERTHARTGQSPKSASLSRSRLTCVLFDQSTSEPNMSPMSSAMLLPACKKSTIDAACVVHDVWCMCGVCMLHACCTNIAYMLHA